MIGVDQDAFSNNFKVDAVLRVAREDVAIYAYISS